MYSTLLLDITGNLATLTLNRPDKRNAISAAMISELQSALDAVEKSHARVGILTGNGKEMGLVNEIVAPEKLMDRAKELADLLIAASPSSLTRAKRLLTTAAAASVDADLERAVLENARIRCTPDFQEGLASFLEKRKPVWRGDKE